MRILVLKRRYNLSDEQMEYQLLDPWGMNSTPQEPPRWLSDDVKLI